MNNPEPASEAVAETEPGASLDQQLNPHMGHLDPDQTQPDGDKEPAPDQAKTGEESDSPSDGKDKAETKPDGDALQRKVGELAYENRQLKRRLEDQQRQQQEPGDPTPEPLKTLKDFGYDEQQFNQYLIDEGARRGAEQARRAMSEDTAMSEAESRQREFEIREDAFEAENPGFKERLHADDLMISPEMAMFIADPASEVGLHVGDYLSKNKTEAARIAGMSPTEQMRAMTQLETRIGKEVAKAKAEKTKASDAPTPPTGLDGDDPGVKTRDPSNPADADNMSDDEWLAARNKQLEAKRKRK